MSKLRMLALAMLLVPSILACDPPAPSNPLLAAEGIGSGHPAAAKPAPTPGVDASAQEAPRPAPAGKLRADSPCAAICTRSTELACAKASTCEAVCKASMTEGLCDAEMRAATACMLREPAANWECTEQGLAAIKSGFCEAEQAKVVHCVMAPPPVH
ncbi:MAG: hypothetical protein QM778_06690 [Myxococcales bacterium]